MKQPSRAISYEGGWIAEVVTPEQHSCQRKREPVAGGDRDGHQPIALHVVTRAGAVLPTPARHRRSAKFAWHPARIGRTKSPADPPDPMRTRAGV